MNEKFENTENEALNKADVSGSNLIDGCKLCENNKKGFEAGSFCINNCINGSKFKLESNLKQYLVTYRKVINAPHALLDDEVVTMSKIVEVLNPTEINDLVKNIVDIKRIF